MISINQLSKSYNKKEVLRIENLAINENQCLGVVGNNGAGKTTLFRLLLDLIKADEGEVVSFGNKVAGTEAWKPYTASYLDEHFLIPFFTAEEYFDFVAHTYQLPNAEVKKSLETYQDFFKGEILGQKKYLRDFSQGNKRKVGIVAALIAKPKVLILDEPFANLDPSSQMQLVEILQKLKAESQTTMLISSHDLAHVTKVCERIILIEKGSIIKDLQDSSTTLSELENYFSTR